MPNNQISKVLELKPQNFLTIHEVKDYLRVPHEEDDQQIESMIDAAIDVAESYTGLLLRERLVSMNADIPPSFKIYPKYRPIINIIEATLILPNSKKTILKEDEIVYNPENFAIEILVKRTHCKLNIEYSAGYEPDLLPSAIRQAIMIHVAHMYDQGSFVAASKEIREIYNPYRQIKI